MTKKKIIIILCIMFSIFIGVIIYALATRSHNTSNDSSDSDLSGQNWAYNETRDKDKESNTDSNTDSEESYVQVINDIVYEKLDNLTYEQQAAKEELFSLAYHNIEKQTSEHGKAISAEILDTSDQYHAYVRITFADNKTEDYIAAYDSYQKHTFMNFQTVEIWDYYHSDDNKG